MAGSIANDGSVGNAEASEGENDDGGGRTGAESVGSAIWGRVVAHWARRRLRAALLDDHSQAPRRSCLSASSGDSASLVSAEFSSRD